MKSSSKLVAGGVALLALALLISTQGLSQEKGAAQPPGEDKMAEMMAQWAKVNAKGPEHEHFEKMVGTWDTVTRMWMAPGAPPMESKGQTEFRLILDGRFVEQVYKCESMGMPFEGLGITGYDRFKKKYVAIWMDNRSNAVFTSAGTADASGKVFTYYGTMDDPITGERDIVTRMVIRELTADQTIMEMYEKRAGTDESKTMEMTYTRAK